MVAIRVNTKAFLSLAYYICNIANAYTWLKTEATPPHQEKITTITDTVSISLETTLYSYFYEII